ncbi:MAG: helix-turn-helix domain-containing protein [Nanoarchaeota archaeon]
MSEKYLLFSLDDEKSKKLGEVISNPTCKKIVNLLAEKDLSESEISNELGMPMNTVNYNIKRLVSSGIVEKAKHWWSVKGRRIETYRVANKLIVISPKKSNVYSKLKGLVPVVLISGILTLFVSWYYRLQNNVTLVAEKAGDMASSITMAETSTSGASEAANFVSRTSEIVSSAAWEWFLIGSIVAIVVFMIINWRKL